MHDVLRQRLIRTIESLPDAQIYQVLDYIEFLEAKYGVEAPPEASGLQKFAEGLEDKLRKKAVSPSTIREAFQLISAADKVLSGVSARGKQILTDLNQALDAQPDEERTRRDSERIEADPAKASRPGARQGGDRAATEGSGGAAGRPADAGERSSAAGPSKESPGPRVEADHARRETRPPTDPAEGGERS